MPSADKEVVRGNEKTKKKKLSQYGLSWDIPLKKWMEVKKI